MTSAITSLIRFVVPSSTPFISETKTASSGIASVQPLRFSRSFCEGTESTTNSAPSAASLGSVVARTEAGSSIPGKYSVFSCCSLIVAHTSGRRPQIVTSLPDVREHQAERRAPGAGAEDRDLAHPCSRLDLWGLPISLTPLPLGSKRTAGAVSPRRSSTSPVIAAMIRSVASCQDLGSDLAVLQVGEVDRVADLVVRGPPREQVRPHRVRREDLLRAPLTDRDHRTPVARAIRAAPDLPRIGQPSGSRVIVPSG